MLEDERVAEIYDDYLEAHAAELRAKISHQDAIIACRDATIRDLRERVRILGSARINDFRYELCMSSVELGCDLGCSWPCMKLTDPWMFYSHGENLTTALLLSCIA